jgi:hypothetical protein
LALFNSTTALADPAVGVTAGACTEIQNNLAAERSRLASSITLAKWYPVLNLGLAFRF